MGHEGREAPFVGGDLVSVHEDPCTVRRGIEADIELLVLPLAGDEDLPEIPEVAVVLAARLVGEDVVEAGRHRHLDRVGEACGPPLGDSLALGIELEVPDAREVLDAAGARDARIERCKRHFGTFLVVQALVRGVSGCGLR